MASAVTPLCFGLSEKICCAKAEPQISPFGYALSKNISTKGPLNCRSLGCARDDKGEGGWQRRTLLRSKENCRFLGCARDDKGEGGAPIESGC